MASEEAAGCNSGQRLHPWRTRGTMGSSSGHSSPSSMPAHLISMVKPCPSHGGARVAWSRSQGWAALPFSRGLFLHAWGLLWAAPRILGLPFWGRFGKVIFGPG